VIVEVGISGRKFMLSLSGAVSQIKMKSILGLINSASGIRSKGCV